MSKLHEFEGRDVLQSSVKIVKAGDGLSKAVAVEPTEFAIGDEVYVVLHAVVTKVHYEPLSDTGTLRRVHTLSTETATSVAPEFAWEVIEQQRIAIERAAGVERLPLGDDDGEADDE